MNAMDLSSQQAGQQAMQWAELLAQHSEAPGMLTRTYLTPTHQAAAAELTRWMEQSGLRVRRDNEIGRAHV